MEGAGVPSDGGTAKASSSSPDLCALLMRPPAQSFNPATRSIAIPVHSATGNELCAQLVSINQQDV